MEQLTFREKLIGSLKDLGVKEIVLDWTKEFTSDHEAITIEFHTDGGTLVLTNADFAKEGL
jgi:hypothetical protein